VLNPGEPIKKLRKALNVPVVINAGGKGTRLEPFTKILPKPLIPVGDKPIIQAIMDRFFEFGFDTFYIILNYKGEMIKSYFDNVDLEYTIKYINEPDFLGTAGGLKYLPADFPEYFIFSNCDIIVGTDYASVIKTHLQSNSILTIIGSFQRYTIPYGVLKFSKDGFLDSISEKPEYDFTVNTGIYVLNTEVIDLIPKDKFFHITDLITMLVLSGNKIGVYPVSENSYLDIGQWDEYKKNIGLLGQM
jgi:NDP-sugar pyrophosphorylase family protein